VTTVRLATRGSALARWQAGHVGDLIRAGHPDVTIELVVVSTEGDRHADVPLSVLGGKGVFVKEVQAAVIDGRADVAVHSAKDLPGMTPEQLVIAAVPERADARDGLVGRRLDDIPTGGQIATGSNRRAVQLLALRPDLDIVGLRGNIETRVAKAKDHDAVVVAVAALTRLGMADQLAEIFESHAMVPQVGQGSLAVECRADDHVVRALLVDLDDAPSRRRFECERSFLVELGGDCDLPAGAHAMVDPAGPQDQLLLTAVLADDRGLRRVELRGSDGPALGATAARALSAP
jgi:hydroxymethylbilane synthase